MGSADSLLFERWHRALASGFLCFAIITWVETRSNNVIPHSRIKQLPCLNLCTCHTPLPSRVF